MIILLILIYNFPNCYLFLANIFAAVIKILTYAVRIGQLPCGTVLYNNLWSILKDVFFILFSILLTVAVMMDKSSNVGSQFKHEKFDSWWKMRKAKIDDNTHLQLFLLSSSIYSLRTKAAVTSEKRKASTILYFIKSKKNTDIKKKLKYHLAPPSSLSFLSSSFTPLPPSWKEKKNNISRDHFCLFAFASFLYQFFSPLLFLGLFFVLLL